MNVFGVCNDETQIKRYFFEEFLNFNGLNELACGRELHPIKGILATRLLKGDLRRFKNQLGVTFSNVSTN